jgi:hypothetical protein
MGVVFQDQDGECLPLNGVGFFKFNQEGKIQWEREFFDLAYFLAQLKD